MPLKRAKYHPKSSERCVLFVVHFGFLNNIMVLKITAALIPCTLDLHQARSAALRHPYMSILPFNLAVNGSAQALLEWSTASYKFQRESRATSSRPHRPVDSARIVRTCLTLQRDPSRLPFPHTFPPASPCTSRHPRGIRQRTRRNDSTTDTCSLRSDAPIACTARPHPKGNPTYSSYNDSRSSYSDTGCVLGIR